MVKKTEASQKVKTLHQLFVLEHSEVGSFFGVHLRGGGILDLPKNIGRGISIRLA